MTTICAVDLGLKGAIAFLRKSQGPPPYRQSFWAPSVIPMPTKRVVDLKRRPPLRLTYDVNRISDILKHLDPDVLVVERLHAMPAKMGGGQANFQRGLATGLFVGIAAAQRIPLETVDPREWQKKMLSREQIRMEIEEIEERSNLDITTKKLSLLIAEKLFPDVSLLPTPNCKVPSDGMSDALLMAEWYRQTKGAQ